MKHLLLTSVAFACLSTAALAGGNHAAHMHDAVKSAPDAAKVASFDILAAHVHQNGRTVTFHMTTNGVAGADKPKATGKLGGSSVYSYVWPTSLDPSVVGFEGKTGILALAAVASARCGAGGGRGRARCKTRLRNEHRGTRNGV